MEIEINALDIILLSSLLFCLIIQLIYYWVFLARSYRIARKQEQAALPEATPPLSIIIYASNEADALEQNLPIILEQDYPLFEVVVVNDEAEDESDDVLKRLRHQYKHLYHTYIPEGSKNLSRRKLGLTLGVKAARYDTLLFTDADCVPASKHWLRRMAAHHTSRRKVTLGWTAYTQAEKGWKRILACDYFCCNMQMMAMAAKGRQYLVNGRNLSYDKTLYTEQKGYSKFQYLHSGDDDLFVETIASKDTLRVAITPDSVIQYPLTHKSVWADEKRNRIVTKKYYSQKNRHFWLPEYFSRVLLIGLFIATLTLAGPRLNWPVMVAATLLFAVRTFTLYYIVNKTAKRLNLKKFRLSLLITDLLQPFINVYFYFYRVFRGKENYVWRYEKR